MKRGRNGWRDEGKKIKGGMRDGEGKTEGMEGGITGVMEGRMEKMMEGGLESWIDGWRDGGRKRWAVGEAVQWWQLGKNSATRRHETWSDP